MPTTASIASTLIVPPLQRVIGYGESLAKDIPADRFTHMPHPKMNHAAWNFGHLAIYPNKLLGMLGRADLVKPLGGTDAGPDGGWDTLFGAGSECVDDPTRYPDKDTIVGAFVERHRAVVSALESISDDALFAENPAEGRFRELFPTIGVAANFLCSAHPMMHLGQVSAWRRAIGLGPVM